MDLTKVLILLRGLPGSGKSSLAKVLSEHGTYPIFSIDDFFTDQNTLQYQFDFSRNHLAYKHCEDSVVQAMQIGVEKIIVHNTFTMEWELQPYFKASRLHHYAVFVCTVENRHNGKNVHGVSEQQIKKMAEKFKVTLI